MGQPDGAAVLAAIANDPTYAPMFQDAYGRPPNYEDVGRAIAAFERTLVFLDAPFDALPARRGRARSRDEREARAACCSTARRAA